jgi:quinol monooxygenase YgiN
LLPALRQQAGFRAYYAVRFDGGGGVFSISVFDDRDAMIAANALALDGAASSLADLFVGAPEVTTSDVTVHLDAQQPGRDAYVIVRMTDDLGPASGVLPAVQERLVPLTLAEPGFRYLYTGRDEARPDRSVAASVFANRDTATAVHAQVVALTAQHRDVWPSPTRIILAGEVLVSAIS